MPRVEEATIGSAANNVGGNVLKRLANDLKELASPIDRGEKVTVAIERSARRCGLTAWRVFNIWYGKARSIEPREIAAITAALDKKRKEAARNEFHELKTRLAILESRLNQIDPDFHSPTIDAAWAQMRRFGCVDSA